MDTNHITTQTDYESNNIEINTNTIELVNKYVMACVENLNDI
jgi:hypothetical protein